MGLLLVFHVPIGLGCLGPCRVFLGYNNEVHFLADMGSDLICFTTAFQFKDRVATLVEPYHTLALSSIAASSCP